MVRKRPSISSLVFFLFSSIFLLLVQLGFVSSVGLFIVTFAQFTVLFWLSIVLFVSSLAILLTQYPHYAKWSMGYRGDCVRTVRMSGSRKDYFIRGKQDAIVRDVLLDGWPFKPKSPNSDWQIFDSLGNEVSNQLLESITYTLEVVFPHEDSA
ncbi:MAG: hypothetical protein E3J86_07605 [Candidatus Thorarchaeota archaeon]|nr:MAG: hypothetical protein E3J86_07605 [Candidatus Thorarchaeota archaeon]